MLLVHKLLRTPSLLIKKKISEKKLYKLYQISQETQSFEYFAHTVRFLFVQLTNKYLSLDLHEEAVYFALKTKLPEILKICEEAFSTKKDAAALAILKQFE